MLRKIENVEYDFPNGDYFIDVGGNRGTWSIEFYEAYKNIIFIDPSRQCIDEARNNIKTHCEYHNIPYVDKITFMRNFVSNQSGQSVDIYSCTNDTANYSLYAKELYGANNVTLSETSIETITLDSLMSNIPNESKILIKIDTEGADLDVLLGASKLINKFKPLIVVEMHWHMFYDKCKKEMVFWYLKSLGYTFKTFLNYYWINQPDIIADGTHTGREMVSLHFQMIMIPPS